MGQLLLSPGKSESYMKCQYVAWIEPSLLFGYNDKMSGIRLFLDRSCAVCLWDRCPIRFARVQWCNCANVVSNQRKGCIRLRRPHQGALAAESAAELPLMPTWPGTQTKTISFPFRIKSECGSWIFIRIGWPSFILCKAWRDDKESDKTRKDFFFEW